MATDKRRRTIRRLFRKNKAFWLGQYAQLLASGLDADEALEEVTENFKEWAIYTLSQRLDKAVRWRFIQNPQIRARFEEADGGVFQAVLKAAVDVVELARRPFSGLLEDSGTKSILSELFADFSDLLEVEEVIVEAPNRGEESRRTVTDRRTEDIPTIVTDPSDAPSAGQAKSRLLGLTGGS